MDPVSTAASFLSILKGVINFEPSNKSMSGGFDKAFDKYGGKNATEEEKKMFMMAKRLVLNKPRTQSITKQLEKAIAHYPLIVSDSISSEVAIDLSKINESRIAEYIKIILQTDKSALDIDKYEDIGDFMNQFKGTSIFRAADVNELVKEGCELEDVYEILESLMKDEVFYSLLNEDYKKDTEELRAKMDENRKKNEEKEKNPDNSKEPNKVDVEQAKKDREALRAKMDENRKNAKLESYFFEAKNTPKLTQQEKKALNQKVIDARKKQYEKDSINKATGDFQKKAEEDRLKAIKDAEKEKRDQEKYDASVEKRKQTAEDRAKKDKEEAEKKYINQKAVDHNIKVAKGANQTVPTVVEAEITFMKGDSQAVKKVYLAIKSMLHIVPGTDMMNAIAGKIAKGGFLTKVIKWYTGEISFIRDIFLNLDEIKSVEGTSTNKGQYIVDKLFDFTKRGNVNAILDETGEGKFIPTTTLAISIDDVMYLKSISGINLLVENDARRIMKDMGLLAVMVVDELKDILYVFDDGLKTSYEVFSLSGKTKEDKTNSKLMTAFFGNKKV